MKKSFGFPLLSSVLLASTLFSSETAYSKDTFTDDSFSEEFLYQEALSQESLSDFVEANRDDNNRNDEESAFDDDWDDSDWEETNTSPWIYSSFIEVAYGHFTQDNIVQSSASLNEISTRIDLSYSHEVFELITKTDLKYDQVLNEAQINLREFSLAFSPTDLIDIKAGKQTLTWGTGDYLFLNDLFPKDWQSFFSGRDDQYLKAPSTSVKTTGYYQDLTFDIVWMPNFTPDNYINGERFSYFSPNERNIIAPAQPSRVETTDESQWSLRISGMHKSVEYAFYGYKGFWSTPQGLRTNHNGEWLGYFPKLKSWGASARLPLAKGLFNIEYASYNSMEDPHGNAPLIANSQNRLLIGYERELKKNFTISGQFYLEHTKNYASLLAANPLSKALIHENRQVLTLRLSYLTMQQKLRYTLFNFYSPTDDDGYLKPSVNYRYSDQWNYALGANIFYGKNQHSFFGQHQQNSNIWLRVKAQF